MVNIPRMLNVSLNRKIARTDLSKPDPHLNSIIGSSADKELLQKLAYLLAVFESSQDAIITKDLNGIITGWNPAAEKIYGYQSDEVIGQPISLIIPPELKDDYSQIVKKLKKGERIEYYDTVRMRKDGKRAHISLSISPIKDTGGKVVGVSSIARDISERIELEKRKDDFISIASHELKTPLTTLKGFSQIILSYAGKFSPEINNYIKRMAIQVDKLNILVNQLLDASKIKSGKITLNKERFLIDGLVLDVVNNIQAISLDHLIILDLKAKSNIRADRFRIEQVLVNIISNAIKYSPKAKEVIVKTRSTPNLVHIFIQDFGIGIFPKDQDKIFEQFYQARNKIRGSSSGLGLGLFICAEIIKRHRGKIEVESIKGEGSTFCIQIPKK